MRRSEHMVVTAERCLQIDGEVFEHLNRKVIQIYGVNLSASK
jgi:hypothetical protein